MSEATLTGIDRLGIWEIDLGDHGGFYAKGCIDARDFADAVNEEYGTSYTVAHVQYGKLRRRPALPHERAETGWDFIVQQKDGRGSFNATFIWTPEYAPPVAPAAEEPT